MLLSVPERLTLLHLLSRDAIMGNLVTLKLLRKLREALSFTDNEVQDFKIKQAKNQVGWDNTAAQDVEIEVVKTMEEVVVSELKKLDQQKRLTEAHVSLYEKFVQPDGQG